ncbi:MAG: nucleotidyltransferase domain-containing protein [Candidatus Hydrogenedentota bacterium]
MEQLLESLPPSIVDVVKYAIDTLRPRRIYLFGSRARGDARELSDFDLAFDLDEESRGKWLRFCADVDELPLTLRAVDYVALHDAPGQLRDEILRTGKVIYGRE